MKSMLVFALFALACNFASAALVGANLPLGGAAGACPESDGENPVYLLDLKNRYVFYECSNGQPILMYCNDGLVFSPKNNTCDFPASRCGAFGPVGECPKEECDAPAFLRDAIDMSVMYMCVDGEAEERQCEEGLLFDPYREACFTEL
ncbi:UNVERIFIED_CONTAM: hypothetical protein PYX00_008172 [Menopon gallinae]|uniref:Chitin-binding type-2 domain-containing protein n=1 Tax=Menopon gallinae TaxID=328185 RepID=A0AAW2HLW9_9NEOP